MKIRIDFNAPSSLELVLTPNQLTALEDERSWEPFIDACYEDIVKHLVRDSAINNISIV